MTRFYGTRREDVPLGNIEQNLKRWGSEHHWERDGDEWRGQAELGGKSYEDWKRSLIDTLIFPNVEAESRVLEIAPGHGRWSESLIASAKHVTLVDVSSSCLEFCRNRFATARNVEYYLTDGT